MSKRGGKGKEKAEPDENETNFEALEKEFEGVLSELLSNQNLHAFRAEYEKLHEVLITTHENELKLINKVKELNSEIEVNAAKVATAIKLSQEDKVTLALLKKEVEKAWKMVEFEQEKETVAKDTIMGLRQEIQNLMELVERGARLSSTTRDSEGTSRAGGKLKHMEMKPDEAQETESIKEMKKELEDMKTLSNEKDQEYMKLKTDFYQLQLDLRNRSLDLQRERSRRAKLEVGFVGLCDSLVR